MGRVQAVTLGQHLAQGGQLVGGGIARRHIGEPGGHAERTLVQHPTQQGAHGLQFGGIGCVAAYPHHRNPQGAMADQGGDIEGDAALLGSGAVAVKVNPVQGGRVVADPGQKIQVKGQVLWVNREGRETAIAGNVGRDPLADLALAPAIDQQAHVGMGLDVDKTR